MTSSLLSELPWVNSFTTLGQSFYSPVVASALKQPYWVHTNHAVAEMLGLNGKEFENQKNLLIASGNITPQPQASIAMVYAGHQFGGYSPQLGDGRGLLIGQLSLEQGITDLHLKGAGKTPYSRFGDGRAVLRSSIREYLAGEAMHALGVPSSRALCLVGSDDPVARETVETAAMIIRTAKTHIRFGHFEYFHYQQQFDQVKQLAVHVIEQFLPALAQQQDRYGKLLRFVVIKTAKMIAQWQSIGFAHGVMNTDNMSIMGETLDYGPYGFLDDYEPGFICNHSDHQGRYAFDQQPSIGLWNLNALAHALSSLIDDDTVQQSLRYYETTIVEHYALLMRKKFGLMTAHEDDQSLCATILHLMAKDKVDYTVFFRRLSQFSVHIFSQHKTDALLDELFQQKDALNRWLQRYADRLTAESSSDEQRQQSMRQINPKYILRNYLLQTAIEKAQHDKDFSIIDQLMTVIQSPFDEHPNYEKYAKPPSASGKHLPISCSS